MVLVMAFYMVLERAFQPDFYQVLKKILFYKMDFKSLLGRCASCFQFAFSSFM